MLLPGIGQSILVPLPASLFPRAAPGQAAFRFLLPLLRKRERIQLLLGRDVKSAIGSHWRSADGTVQDAGRDHPFLLAGGQDNELFLLWGD